MRMSVIRLLLIYLEIHNQNIHSTYLLILYYDTNLNIVIYILLAKKEKTTKKGYSQRIRYNILAIIFKLCMQ